MKPNHHPVSNVVRSRARTMRKKMTDAELKLWNEIRAHRLAGLSFRRQMPVGSYIVDFACPAKRLIVEVDGSQHAGAEAAEKDVLRTRALEDLGWTVLRFWNDDILRDIDNVCLHIVTVTVTVTVTVAGLTAANAASRGRRAGPAATPEEHPR